MQLPDITKITVDKIHDPLFQSRDLQLDVLRLDKIHPVISGNKWFKLKSHLVNYNAGNYNGILTFGGAWSNHIVATACTCRLLKIKCAGIIRGEKPPQLSITLKQAMEYGMQLEFVTREKYQQRSNAHFINSLEKEYPGFYVIPEGGAGHIGEKGAGEIMDIVKSRHYTHIACAVGTGTMFNGIKKMALPGQQIVGTVVLKGWSARTLERSHDGPSEEKEVLSSENLICDYHFGGYAKHTPELLSFMNEFYKHSNIPTDFVYTGKLAFAIYDLVRKDRFPPGSKILMIHSGGLQGNTSLQKGSLIFQD